MLPTMADLFCVFVLYRQGGAFNVEYANTFPELAKLNLTTSNVLDYVTKDQYNFATVSSSVFSFLLSRQRRKNMIADYPLWERAGGLVLLLARQLRKCSSHGEERQ